MHFKKTKICVPAEAALNRTTKDDVQCFPPAGGRVFNQCSTNTRMDDDWQEAVQRQSKIKLLF